VVTTLLRKSFHYVLGKIKALKYKCKVQGKLCKRMTDGFVDRAKHSIRNLMTCEEVFQHGDPYQAFSEALFNFHNHYCKNLHDSAWIKFHPATSDDGSPYSTKSPLLCTIQADAFWNSSSQWLLSLRITSHPLACSRQMLWRAFMVWL